MQKIGSKVGVTPKPIILTEQETMEGKMLSKKKKVGFVVFVVVLVLLVSCAGYNSVKCYEAVLKSVPHGKVYTIVGEKFRFVAVDDSTGNVFYIETMKAHNTNITQKTLLFNVSDHLRETNP